MATTKEKLTRLRTSGRVPRLVSALRKGGADANFPSDLARKGDVAPRAYSAIKIAKALGVTADWLWDDDRDWPPDSPPRCERPHADDIDPRLLAINQEVQRLVGLPPVEMLKALEAAWASWRAANVHDRAPAEAKSRPSPETLGRVAADAVQETRRRGRQQRRSRGA